MGSCASISEDKQGEGGVAPQLEQQARETNDLLLMQTRSHACWYIRLVQLTDRIEPLGRKKSSTRESSNG